MKFAKHYIDPLSIAKVLYNFAKPGHTVDK